MSNSTRAILANISRNRNNEIERYFYNNFKQKFNETKNKYFNSCGRFLLGATIFSFAEDKITDEEIQHHFKEFYGDKNVTTKINESNFKEFYGDEKVTTQINESVNVSEEKPIKIINNNSLYGCENKYFADYVHLESHRMLQNDNSKRRLSSEEQSNFIDSTWTQMIDSESVKLWRRPLKSNCKLYEYRLCGSFNDISAKDFFFVQTDIEYRKSWDDLVVDLRILRIDDVTLTETIHWITHYPYPMKDREYLFKRRSIRNELQETAIIVSKSISGDSLKCENSLPKNIEVQDYKSIMYIQAHNKFDQHGIDYYLIYNDDPKTSFPSAAVSWMSTAGIPSFMDKVHKAALKLEEKRKMTQDSFEEICEVKEDNNNDRTTKENENENERTSGDISYYSYLRTILLLFNFSKLKTDNDLYNVQKSQ